MINKRPSEVIVVGNTTKVNSHIPMYIGHSDSAALHFDYFAKSDSLDVGLLGSILKPVVEGSSRNSLLQINTGGEMDANIKLVVENIHPYIMREDNHYPPLDLEEYSRRFMLYQEYIQKVMALHPQTYITVTSQKTLIESITSVGRIGLINSVEGMPYIIGSVSDAAKLFADSNTMVINLMCNQNTDVGDSHTTAIDNGLTLKGKDFLQRCANYGIPVFDVSHASPKTAMDMLRIIGPNRRVIASHTGTRIGAVSE